MAIATRKTVEGLLQEVKAISDQIANLEAGSDFEDTCMDEACRGCWEVINHLRRLANEITLRQKQK